MVSFQPIREAYVRFVGLLAASLASIGIDASNNHFNGRPVDLYSFSRFLMDGMIIRRFYLYETLIHHNFVVFQTDSGHTFKVHLHADMYSDRQYSPLYVEIGPTYWRPGDRYVERSNRRVEDLKLFVLYEMRNFGAYEVGFNDCRQFAQSVAAFLAG